jgi:hypothetical protein
MANRKSWRQVEMPMHDGNGWAIWKDNKKISYPCINQIIPLVEKWLPPNPMLVGEPGGTRFVPPILVAQFSKTILRTIGRYYRNLLVVSLCTALTIFILWILKNSMESLILTSLLLLMAILFYIEGYYSLHNEHGIFERAVFFFWIRTDKCAHNAFIFWVSLMLLVGCFQLLLQYLLGGMDALFHNYGMMYPAVRAGELWRLAIGPFFHYTLLHFFVNLFLLALIGTTAWALRGGKTVIIFIIGNICGAFAQLTWGGQLFDNYGGVSAGIYALFGFIIASNVLERKLLPKGLGIFLMGLAVVGIASSELLSQNMACVAHLTGAVIGIMIAFTFPWSKMK